MSGFAITLQALFCMFIASWTLYSYIDQQNAVTVLRLEIPNLAKEVREIQEKNMHLQYEIDQLESPIRLMELVRKPEFSHLKYPNLDQILVLPEETILTEEPPPL